jgi:hypothetical protein
MRNNQQLRSTQENGLNPHEWLVTPDKAPFDLPDYWASIGMDDGTAWSEKEVKDSWDCNERWNKALKEALVQKSEK